MAITITLILIISFVASLVRSTIGFGESLIAVPLFLLFLPVEVAVPLSVMLSIIIALIVVIQDHRQIHFYSAKWLIIYGLLGVPIGIYMLVHVNQYFVKIALGVLLILYCINALFAKSNKVRTSDSKWWLIICGFLSGVFGGAYGLNGPPLVIYGTLRQWSAKHFRATLQAYFLPVSMVSVLGYYGKGFITSQVNIYFLFALITTIPAVFLGRYLNQKLKDLSFIKYVYWGLLTISVILILTTLIH